jgi:DNA-directed RNA polymerase specialized sigma24 family protein
VADVNAGGDAACLQALLRQALETLTRLPKDGKFHRALRYTYFEPGLTQEAAAERLGLPFNTYRYHLARGSQRIVEWLWERELAGSSAGALTL